MSRAIAITATVYFVKHSKAVVDTLFRPGNTASGTFQVKPNGVLFFRLDGRPFAFLCANNSSSPFFVSCHRLEDRRIRYMHGLSDEGLRLLGLSALTYRQRGEAAEAVLRAAQQLAATA